LVGALVGCFCVRDHLQIKTHQNRSCGSSLSALR
jgi:hypothetical protein